MFRNALFCSALMLAACAHNRNLRELDRIASECETTATELRSRDAGPDERAAARVECIRRIEAVQ